MPKTSRFSGALKPAEFNAAVRRHQLAQNPTLGAARLVLVGGATLEAAAQAHGLTRQRVYHVARILHRDALPAGWVTGTVSLPPDLMEKVRALEAGARAKWERQQEEAS